MHNNSANFKRLVRSWESIVINRYSARGSYSGLKIRPRIVYPHFVTSIDLNKETDRIKITRGEGGGIVLPSSCRD